MFCLMCFAFCPSTAVFLGSGQNTLRGSSVASECQGSVSALELFVNSVIYGVGKVRCSHAFQDASEHMDFNKAADTLKQKHVLPKEVSGLLASSSTNTSKALAEESLRKARQFLYGLVGAAYKELDDKVIQSSMLRRRYVTSKQYTRH